MAHSALCIEDHGHREEGLHGYFGASSTTTGMHDDPKSWALLGLEPDFSLAGAEFIERAEAPLVLVGYESHDSLYGLEASIEESSAESRLQLISYPGVESGERDLPLGPWVQEAAARFAELLARPLDWDGHGASPIASANVLAAGRFLATVMAPSTPAPTIVPTSTGGLQLEWHRAGFDVELLFGEEDPPLLYVAEIDSGREWEGLPVEGFAEFDLAQRLGG